MINKNFLDDIVSRKRRKPSDLDVLFYIFWEKGISYEEFRKLPLPYILGVLNTHAYFKEQEAEELEKAKRKRR